MRKTQNPFRALGILCVALTAMLALACGADQEQDSTPTPQPAAGAMTGPVKDIDDGMARLYAAATAAGEKKVIVGMGPTSIPFINEKMVPLFEKRFPGIDVQLKQYDSFQMGVQVHTELASKVETADVVTNALIQIKPLLDAGEIDVDIDWVALGASKARAGDLNLLHNTDGVCGATLYNTQYVKESDLPSSVFGYTDPKFKGKLSAEPGDAMACLAFYAIKFNDYAAYEKLGKDLVANGWLLTPNKEQLLLSGERPIQVISSTSRVPLLQAQGAPVKIKLYPGTGMFRTRWATIKGAPNANAAKLWSLWMTSKEAMEVWDEQFKGGSGFSGEDLTGKGMPAWLKANGYDSNDTTLFIKETALIYGDRAKFSATLREAIVK